MLILKPKKQTKMEHTTIDGLDLKAPEKKAIKLNTGLASEAREEVANALKQFLADTFCFMVKTQNYHWNIKGHLFRSIHLLTEEHYENMFEAVDVIAERIRSLGYEVPGTLTNFKELSTIKEPEEQISGVEMIADLLKGHEQLINTCRDVISSASRVNDEGTADLVIERLKFHEKAAWMYRSYLEV